MISVASRPSFTPVNSRHARLSTRPVLQPLRGPHGQAHSQMARQENRHKVMMKVIPRLISIQKVLCPGAGPRRMCRRSCGLPQRHANIVTRPPSSVASWLEPTDRSRIHHRHDTTACTCTCDPVILSPNYENNHQVNLPMPLTSTSWYPHVLRTWTPLQITPRNRASSETDARANN